MKLTVVLVLVAASASAADPDLSGVLKLSTTSAIAHACPIGMDKALTNAHVVQASSEWLWGQGNGEEFHGIAVTDWTDGFRDLAQVVPSTETRFPKWYALAEKAPKIGEKVYFLGYDFRKQRDAYGPRTLTAKVTGMQNGMLVFDAPGNPGSSGSCILNEAGEVVAINKSGRELDNGDQSGQGVAVWGKWLQLKKPEPKPEEPQTYFEGTD